MDQEITASATALEGMTKRDLIASELRRLILAGEVQRGSKLQQDELARRFQSSITPVREALRDLEAEGLVESEPHRGVRVASPSLEHLTAIYISRRLLESHAVGRATTRMSPRAVSKARELMHAAHDASDADDRERARDLNRELHFFIYEHAELPPLVKEIARYWRMFPWDMVLTDADNVRDAAQQHSAVLDAIEAGDSQAAAEAVGRHIAEAFFAIVSRLTGGERPSVDPFDYNSD